MPATQDTTIAYGVLTRDYCHEIEIKRSRFICYLSRVESTAQARDAIAQVRAEHRTARHHCTAHVIGPDRMERRSNDDGEPSGTAGMPMLDALTKFQRPGADTPDCSDLVAVVVRYFGGVLLGAGGLVHAYSDAVSQALQRAQFHTRRRMHRFSLPAPHADAGRWENELRAENVTVLETQYELETARIQLAIVDEPAQHARLHERIAALTAGSATLEDAGVAWVG
nr:YigZ family protein [Pseudoclavibacter sp. Marseille-Q3772]